MVAPVSALDRLTAGVGRAGSTAAANATATGFLAGWRLVRRLPEPAAQRVFRRVGDEIFRRDGAGVRRLRGNLHVVRPELDDAALEDLTRRAVRSYLRYWCESFRLPAWPLEDLVARTRTVREEVMRTALGQGRGLVVPLPHTANWDWAGAWTVADVAPMCTVAERLRPERLYDEFVAYRRSLGMEVLPLTGGAPVLPRLEAWVREGGVVCLLGDRDLSRTGVEVTLCGQRARMPRGPAVLALRTGAPLVPVTLHYDGDAAGDGDTAQAADDENERRQDGRGAGWRPGTMTLTFHGPVQPDRGAGGPARMTQAVADAFTEGLRAHPEDWHMMQRVFLDPSAAPRPAPGRGRPG